LALWRSAAVASHCWNDEGRGSALPEFIQDSGDDGLQIRDPAAANADGNPLAGNLAVKIPAIELAFDYPLNRKRGAERKLLANIDHFGKLHMLQH
jgi:hypothetical protein